MDRHELNRMFDGLAPEPGREGELLEELLRDGARRKRPVKNWRRIAVGLAAAALLAGTATAAHYLGVSVVDEREDDGDIWFAGGITYYPADQLSDEVKKFTAAYADGTGPGPLKTFQTWDEMEEFLGVDIMNNPLLVESTRVNYYAIFRTQKVKGPFTLRVDSGLNQLWAWGYYRIGDAYIKIMAFLHTDRLEEKGIMIDRIRSVGVPDGAEVSWEAYTTPGGREAQVIALDGVPRHFDQCVGAISLNGIPVVVSVGFLNSSWEDDPAEGAAEARKILLQVLDGFQ